MMGFYSAKKEQWTKQNVCEAAAIYGLDGTLWASSDKWKGLSEYSHDVEDSDGSATTVNVNEFAIAEKVSTGNRNASQAGVRMGNQKYIFTTYDEGIANLSRLGGGGGVIIRTSKAIVIGIWDKEAKMSNNLNQNQGDCLIGCERVAKFMKAASF